MNYGNFNMFPNNFMNNNNMYNNNIMNMNMNMNMNNNMYNNNIMNTNMNMNMNNIFPNNFNGMNNNMYINNLNNMYSYNMMMNMFNNQMMMNMYTQKQKIALMNEYLKKIMEKNKNESNNQSNENDNNNDNNDNSNEQEQESEENKALSDVAKELELQRQNFEQYPFQNNINYNEVDPEFMHSFISDKSLFCGSGHNLEGKWAHGENRGGRPYNPPDGWIGFGLNVLNKYDDGNNDWLACDGRPGEWCIAYHGACVRSSSDQIKQIIKPILEQNLKPGAGQACSGHSDLNHPGQTVGVGVYCSPNPTVIDGYAGIIEVNGFSYKVAFMLRVKPDKIRISSSTPDYWVLNAGDGNFSEMRPYRFLIRKI